MREQREGRVRLPDGRWVQFTDSGPTTAPVVMYCHGIPGSRQEIGWSVPSLARSGLRVRLLALNRPGYGASTWHRGHGFASWASDAEAVLNVLGVDRCSVLGASGGAPFALAFAAEHAERVTRIGLAAAAAPPGVAGMEHSALWRSEPRSRRARAVRYAALSAGYRAGLAPWLERQMLGALGAEDREALSHPWARAVLHQVVAEAFAQRGRAAAHESGLLLAAWGIDPARVPQPVRVWHGGRDTRIPADVAFGLADLLPGAAVSTWPEHGHFSWAVADSVVEVAEYLTGP